jgi:hypothetical protein
LRGHQKQNGVCEFVGNADVLRKVFAEYTKVAKLLFPLEKFTRGINFGIGVVYWTKQSKA